MNYLLECPRCLSTKHWDSDSKKSPGECICKSFQNWRVIKNPRPRGFVVVYSDKGKQELSAKYNWRERSDMWRK